MADNIPEGLDDLLNSIRGEGKSSGSSALAIIPKAEKKESDSVDNEDIDPAILRLLGLEDVFDIDYDTYKTLLREKMAAGRMADSKIPTEEVQLLTEEFKRVKGKTGRFKVKSQKIKKESFVGKKKPTVSKAVKALPGKVTPKDVVDVTPESPKTDETLQEVSAKLAKVSNNVGDVIKTLSKQNKEEAQAEEKKRVTDERKSKKAKEELRERAKLRVGMPKILGKAMAPISNIMESIMGTFRKLALAKLVMEIIKFLENPIEYFRPIVDWGNSMIAKINEFTKSFLTDHLTKVNDIIKFFNGQISSLQNALNHIIGLIPGNLIPNFNLGQIPLIPISKVVSSLSIPSIPFPQAQTSSTLVSASPSTPAVNVNAGQLLSSNAKTTYYDPSLGGINASGAKTASGLPATSTGEGYDPNAFTAAAFPELIAKLPRSMTTAAPGFHGGRTLARGQAFNVIVTNKDGKSAVVRVNDVGSGVQGHAANHLLDFSVAAKNYLGTGEGFTVRMAPQGATPGPVQPMQSTSAAQLSSSSVRPTTAPPPPPTRRNGSMLSIGVPLGSSGNGQGVPHSASNAGQKSVTVHSALDYTNSSIMSTKALFNIVE